MQRSPAHIPWIVSLKGKVIPSASTYQLKGKRGPFRANKQTNQNGVEVLKVVTDEDEEQETSKDLENAVEKNQNSSYWIALKRQGTIFLANDVEGEGPTVIFRHS